MKYIKDAEELKKYIGKLVLFYYKVNGRDDLKFAWVKTITKIELNYPFINHVGRKNLTADIYGTNTVAFFLDGNDNIASEPKLIYKGETSSNAQEYARELELNEKIIYRIITHKKSKPPTT